MSIKVTTRENFRARCKADKYNIFEMKIDENRAPSMKMLGIETMGYFIYDDIVYFGNRWTVFIVSSFNGVNKYQNKIKLNGNY